MACEWCEQCAMWHRADDHGWPFDRGGTVWRDAEHIAENTPRRVLAHIVSMLGEDCPLAYPPALDIADNTYHPDGES